MINHLPELIEVDGNFDEGLQLPMNFRLPLLIIPLSFRCAFIVVCVDAIVVCEGLVEGTPTYINLSLSVEPPTEYHQGLGAPLWTAYAKPMRFSPYADHHDDLYLARGDGVVKFIEVSGTHWRFGPEDLGDFWVSSNNEKV